MLRHEHNPLGIGFPRLGTSGTEVRGSLAGRQLPRPGVGARTGMDGDGPGRQGVGSERLSGGLGMGWMFQA